MSTLKFIAAVFIAAAGSIGASAFMHPVIASAQLQQWDEAGFNDCAEGYEAQREDDYVGWYYGVRQCCISYGGVWRDQQPGQAPRCDPPQPIVHIPPGGVIETFSPAPPPPVTRVPLGDVTATFAPAPVG